MAKEIHLTNGGIAVVDDEDYPRVMAVANWRQHDGYVQTTNPGKHGSLSLHRLIMRPPRGMSVDHISGDRLDNRRCNLRICSHANNLKNTKMHRDNSSGFKGVRWSPQDKAWISRIGYNGQTIWVGSYETIEEAAKQYDQAAYFFHQEYAAVNFIDIPQDSNWKLSYRLKSRRKQNTSIYRGVAFDKARRQWKARCGNTMLGRFCSEELAARAYDAAARLAFGDKARLNFPE